MEQERRFRSNMDDTDRKLLNHLQSSFPLSPYPYSDIARALGLSQDETLARIRDLKERGILRQVSAIFDSKRLGYRSTLAALRLPFSELDRAGAVVSRHPGVSHNYARNHIYDLWFTITLPASQSLEEEVSRLALEAGAQSFLILPMVRQFKLDARFDMITEEAGSSETATSEADGTPQAADTMPASLSPLEMEAVKELQEDLPVEERPFKAMAERLDLSEVGLLSLARDFQERGIMRRYSAQLRHRQAGFIANAMGCWIVPEERMESAGRSMAAFAQVTHCYQRPTYPDWPYSLFTMIHAQSRAGCEAVASDISRGACVTDFILLFSMQEYKKARVKYLQEGKRALAD